MAVGHSRGTSSLLWVHELISRASLSATRGYKPVARWEPPGLFSSPSVGARFRRGCEPIAPLPLAEPVSSGDARKLGFRDSLFVGPRSRSRDWQLYHGRAQATQARQAGTADDM